MRWREWIHIIPLRLRSLFRRRRVERDLDDEIAFHLAIQAAVNQRAGIPTPAAEQRARQQFGAVAYVKDRCRDALQTRWIDDLAADLRYAIRSLRRSPVFTLVALASLAIGIGANAAAFSWADALLLRPLPVPRPDNLVTVGSKIPFEGAGIGTTLFRVSYPELVDLRDRATSFDGFAAYTGVEAGLAPTRGAPPVLSIGHLVNGAFFDVLGVQPALGRAFRPEEDQVPGRDAVAVLGHGLWMRVFAGDPRVIGRHIFLNGIDFTVVGVAPAGFFGIDQSIRPDFFAPIMMWPRFSTTAVSPLEARDRRYITAKGRLKAGIDPARTQVELSTIATSLEREYPETERNRQLAVRTELQNRIGELPPLAALLAMLGTLAAAVLLVACANVAGLLTSRAPARSREIATRVALGASGSRIVRQLLTESLLMAMGGGLAGLAAGYAAVSVFQLVQIPTDLPVAYVFQLDRRVVFFALIAAILSVLLFGLAPAVQASRVDVKSLIAGTEAAGGRRRLWVRNLLVVSQVAISAVLLVVAMFMYRGLQPDDRQRESVAGASSTRTPRPRTIGSRMVSK
jgi:macrolide transport system ATP-binding/permease protein